jgi:hypothetical protein
MNRVVARLLKHLYPCGWKKRYGAEFEAFLRRAWILARFDIGFPATSPLSLSSSSGMPE